MKQSLKYIFVVLFFSILNISTLPASNGFKKLSGSLENEKPTRIIHENGFVYIIGQEEDAGVEYAFFAKFDGTTGARICEQRLDEISIFNDLAFNPNTQEFVVVGNLNFSQSIICTFDLNCNIVSQKVYDQTGREEFTRVIFHEDALDPAQAIYVLGRKNPTAVPSGFDIAVLYNFDDALNSNWVKEYPEVGGVELEIYRGLTALSSGNLILLGNGTNTNEGALVHVDGSTGDFLQGVYYLDALDIYDAIEIPSTKDIVLAGTDFGNKQALLMIIDKNFVTQSVAKYPDSRTFYDIGLDINEDVYAVAKGKNTSPVEYPIIHKLDYIVAGSNRYLGLLWKKNLYDGETSFEDPHLYVSDDDDHVYFTDGRTHPILTQGDHDLLVAKLELDFDCACVNVLNETWFESGMTVGSFVCVDPTIPEPSLEPDPGVLIVNDPMSDYCNYPICDIAASINCFKVDLVSYITGGTGPLLIEWDIDCDAIFEYTGINATHTFPPIPNSQSHCITMRVTDALGLQCTSIINVTVEDITPPVITCPNNFNFTTDIGVCYKTYFPIAFNGDLCDPSPTLTWQFTGATIGGNGTTQFNVGITYATVTATDASGNSSSCSFTITVVDDQAPLIVCPPDLTLQVTTCNPWATHYPPTPSILDNCPIDGFIEFPNPLSIMCGGIETFRYIVEDVSGNRDTCSYTVTVVCPCGEIDNSSFSCNPIDDDLLDFTIVVNNNMGINGSANCSPSVTTPLSNVSLQNIAYNWIGAQLTITGSADINCAIPTSIPFDVNWNCNCPSGDSQICDLQVSIPTICCKKVYLQPDAICKTAGNYSLPLFGCNDFCDVKRVNWYVANSPCPVGTWPPAFQSTTDCRDLLLDPSLFSGAVCIYAEVILGTDDGPCQSVVSNIITLDLCEPIQMGISSNQRYCYQNAPVVVSPLLATKNFTATACAFTVQWHDQNGPISGANQLSYQPNPLVVTSQNCSETFVYTCKISNICGTTSRSVSITIDNGNAPDGILELYPAKPLALCYGDDATLRYTPTCVDPLNWNWFESLDGVSYSPIPFSGNNNPLFNTNRLFKDKWYRIEKTNGVCPTDQVDLHVPVKSKLKVNQFSATPIPVCNPLQVDLTLTFTPDIIAPSSCNYNVDWYKDGFIISSATAQTSPVSFSYVAPGQLPGNYYAIITDLCCGAIIKSSVITIDPSPEISISGPCFRCNEEVVSLTTKVSNPPAGYVCSYQWYDNGVLLPGETNATLTVHPLMNGPFMVELICTDGTNTCTTVDIFTLDQCGSVCPPIINLTGNTLTGVFHAGNVVNITGHIPAGETVIVRAGSTINIIQPFTIAPTATFIAQIQPCPF